MSRGPILYYVHHHGEGHRQRAQAIATQAPGRFTLAGAGIEKLSGAFDTLGLPDDRPLDRDAFDGLDDQSVRPDALHYAPTHHDGVRERARIVASWIAEKRPALMVVDVSVEMAMLARLCATPTIYVRLAGARWDPAHLDAYRGAQALLAPFDPRCEDADVPDWVRAKTFYASGLGLHQSTTFRREGAALVVLGRGGSQITTRDVEEAARATPDRKWRIIGPADASSGGLANLDVAGWVDHAAAEIAAAGVVIGGAGDGVLGAVAAFGKAYVCIPEDRPFGEQIAKARALETAGAAIVLEEWPAPSRWPELLQKAAAINLRQIAGFHDRHGAAKAVSNILDWADR